MSKTKTSKPFKFKVGDKVKILKVENSYWMSHLIGKTFEITFVCEREERPYEINDSGVSWYFSEEEIAPFEKDILYFQEKKKKLQERLFEIQKDFKEYHEELLDFQKKSTCTK